MIKRELPAQQLGPAQPIKCGRATEREETLSLSLRPVSTHSNSILVRLLGHSLAQPSCRFGSAIDALASGNK